MNDKEKVMQSETLLPLHSLRTLICLRETINTKVGFRKQEKRPGLPADVAALVPKLTDDTTELELVNLNANEARDVIIQAGSMGEHNFTTARTKDGNGENSVAVDGTYLQVHLPPNTQIALEVRMERFVNTPSYQHPWEDNAG